MRSRAHLIGVAVVGLAVAMPAQAAAKEVCCYRVHANSSNTIQHADQGGSGAGAQNGTYELSSQSESRELMSYDPKGYGVDFLARVMTRNQREVRGRAKFRGSERSDQWYMDSSTTPPTRVDYPPCRYAKDVPWRTTGSPAVSLYGGGGGRLDHFGGAAGFTQGSCDNTSPNIGANQWYHPGGGSTSSTPYDSVWDASYVSFLLAHTRGLFNHRKLKKLKDQVVKFEPPTITETSQQPPYTATVTHRTVIRFTWFPYDRLQKELNELNALK
jgi:hypothetical protein